ncbi:disulfide thiol oxidoreductase, Erv1 / Alr family [Indivirus ILV1]|uniref:Sulfhydryl oxidase n=1 Tax=Indivirus ILV1 TaxID=1977633 RepID=A0A1V0SEA9_9VIRU|nr:disulfide thiol oxidoreductase, Erv1 / Alr family [Indivirus ILV1]
MDSDIWGPYFWFMIHSTSFEYPIKPTKNDKKQYKKFYESFKYVLPCEVCRNNYSEHLKETPIDDEVLKSRKNLFIWTVKIHNKVNILNGKKIIDPIYVLKKFEKIYRTTIKL